MRSAIIWRAALTTVAAALAAGGCGRSTIMRSRPQQPAEEAPPVYQTLEQLARQVEAVADSEQREQLRNSVDLLRTQMLFGDLNAPPAAPFLLVKEIQIRPMTQAGDWNGDGQIDGFEVTVEALDGFGDQTKVVGKFYFELFPYRAAHADSRGVERAAYWEVNLLTKEDNLRYWNRFDRAYRFNLVWNQVPGIGEKFVFQATYIAPWGEVKQTQRTLSRIK